MKYPTMRLIGQPIVYKVRIIEKGALINAFEVPCKTFKEARDYTTSLIQKMGYHEDDFEISIIRTN